MEMGGGKDLTPFQKGMIVGARATGATVSETATLVKCSRSSVVKVYQEWQENGETTSNRQNCGAVRKVTPRGERRVKRIIKAERTITVRKLQEEYNQGTSTPISHMTMRRTLARMHFHSRRPSRHPLLTKRHHQLRLNWARQHAQWTVDEWKKVCWSDESKFMLHHADGRLRVWRQQHEAMDPSCVVGAVQAGGGSCMVWGCFCWYGLGPLQHVESCVNAVTYRQVLGDHVHPTMLHFYPAADGVFQDDNATCHRGRIVMEWFEEHSTELQHMVWPPNSPDLSPIEHLWDVIERALRFRDPPPASVRSLLPAIQDIWCHIPVDTFQHLVESMPRRVHAILRSKGGPTKY